MQGIDTHKILTDPSLRAAISKDQVMSLLERFPYNLNLQYLLLEKTADNQLENGDVVKKSSSMAIDRRFLKNKLQALESNSERSLESGRKVNKVSSGEAPKISQTVRVRKNEEEVTLEKQKEERYVNQEAEEKLAKMSKKKKKKQHSVKKEQKNQSEPMVDSFEAWLASLEASVKAVEKESKSKKKKKKGKKKSKKKELLVAKLSLEEDDEVISETLANLLANQGYNEKAIDMYEKLSLLFPEKSTYFARKIEHLKNI